MGVACGSDSLIAPAVYHAVLRSSRVGRMAGIALAAALALGCSESAPARCEALCERDAQCAAERAADEVDEALRKTECMRACSLFERDPEARPRVEERAECVRSAGDDCEVVLACGE